MSSSSVALKLNAPVDPASTLYHFRRSLTDAQLLEYGRLFEIVHGRMTPLAAMSRFDRTPPVHEWQHMREVVEHHHRAIAWCNVNIPHPDPGPREEEWDCDHYRSFPLTTLLERARQELVTPIISLTEDLLHAVSSTLVWKRPPDDDTLVLFECDDILYHCY